VDDVQLGVDIPIDTLYPGQDTTVLATALYSSGIVGPKIIKVKADVLERQPERRENNNQATRAIIVGGAPDFANSLYEAITLSPTLFSLGDSITICNYVRNFGGDGGSAWMRFYYTRLNGEKILIDSVQFTMNENDSFRVCKRWLVSEPAGLIITEIDHSNPPEFDTLNNADTLAFGTIIPLTLLDFNGQLNNRIVALNWKVAQEQGMAHYEVQRSLDGVSFNTIGRVAASNSPLTHAYLFDDSTFASIAGAMGYYRLRMTELDGSFTFSDVVLVRRPASGNQITGYPNPVKHLYQVQIEATEPSRYTLLLLDAAGKQLLSRQVTVQPRQNIVPVNMDAFAKGLYWIRLMREDGEATQLRLVKE
jgi:hypothetical protein